MGSCANGGGIYYITPTPWSVAVIESFPSISMFRLPANCRSVDLRDHPVAEQDSSYQYHCTLIVKADRICLPSWKRSSENLGKHFGDKIKSLKLALGEITLEVGAADYLGVMTALRDEADFVSKRWSICVGSIIQLTVTVHGKVSAMPLLLHLLSVAKMFGCEFAFC